MKKLLTIMFLLVAINSQASLGSWIGDQKVKVFGTEEKKVLRFGTSEEVIAFRFEQLNSIAKDIISFSDRYSALFKNNDLIEASLSMQDYTTTQRELLEYMLDTESGNQELKNQLLAQLKFVSSYYARSVDNVLQRVGEISVIGPGAINFLSTPGAIERAFFRLDSDFAEEFPYYHQVLNNFELL